MTEKQIARVKFISSQVTIPKVTVFLDRDEAGIAGTDKAIALLRSNGFSAEAFDWNQTEFSLATVMDAGDMSAKQLQWLRTQGKI
ncbi:MAG: hypothetical protein U9R17_12275 [Thermodesulfobacteriota bacterium]|nr:hypothetical protein [Thermodesulfobacteriota bacterium]